KDSLLNSEENNNCETFKFGYAIDVAYNINSGSWDKTKANGKVGIGTANPQYKLDVCGTIRSKEWIVEEFESMPDFVFKPEYELMSLDKRKKLIFENSHMPYLLSEEEMKQNGVPVFKTMQGIIQNTEEIYLYLFEMDKRLNELEKENEYLKEKIVQLTQKINLIKN
ncbi:MAG: hypothetical protein PHW82_11935, partial [Bacteroidales bacterium]|nr:hypothetical protein [Bacteroidales bacterium]